MHRISQTLKLWIGAVVWILLLATMAESSSTDLYPIACDQPPTIDAELNDECWQSAHWIADFTVASAETPPDKSMQAAVTYDSENLYLAFVCSEPNPQDLQLRHKHDHQDVWQDDVVEIFLRTGGDRMAIEQLMVNAAGARWSLRRRPGGFQPWLPDWPAAAKIRADHWTVELAVPWKQIGVDRVQAGRLIEVKFGREDHTTAPTRLTVWPAGTVYAGIDDYGRMYLDPPDLLASTGWDLAGGAQIQAGRLLLPPEATARSVVGLRAQVPHSLDVSATGSGVLTMTIGGDHRSLPVTDSAHVNLDFVAGSHAATDAQAVAGHPATTPIRLKAEAGSLDLKMRLRESPRLIAAGPAIPVQAGHPIVIEHVAVEDSRAVRGFIGTPFDGSLSSRGWNGQAWEYPQSGAGAGVGYAFAGNDGLHVRLADDGGFDALQIRGGVRADLYAPGLSYQGPDHLESTEQPLHRFDGRSLRSRALFDERVMHREVSFFKVTDGVMADVIFLRVHDGSLLSKAGAEWPLGDQWTTLQKQTGIDALRIRFDAADKPRQLTLIVDDPMDPRLQLMTVDVEIGGSGETIVGLDIIDQLLPAGTAINVRVVDETGQPFTQGSVRLSSMNPIAAAPEALAHRRFLVKTFFICASEARPWTGLPREGDIRQWFAQHSMGDQLAQLFDTVDHGLWIDPADEGLQQYKQWLYRNRRSPEAIKPVAYSADPAAPAWARWARTAWLAARHVPDWWLQHRLVETGEFGGAVGDDTDLYQNFVDFPFMEEGGVAADLREGAARLADLAQRTTLQDGVNRDTMDPLHAYEEGLNQEALMAVWNYGDPVLLERCMVAARSVADLTTVTDLGHRHFRSQLIGSDARELSATDLDGQAHPAMWHPALEVLWYNGNPLVESWLREWADGWLTHFAPGQYAHAVDVASEQHRGTNARPLYGGYGGQGSAFAFLATITGDRRYAAPFFEAYAEGSIATSPSDLVLDFLHRFGEDAFDGSLRQLPLRGVAAAVVHGDMDALIQALKADAAELQGFDLMYTSSEPFTDRVFLTAIRQAAISYTGGFATRNKFNRSHAVSWSGFGVEYAAFVEKAGPDRFKARLFSFADRSIRGSGRFWQLTHGEYEIRMGQDLDDDGHIDQDRTGVSNVEEADANGGRSITWKQVIRRGEPLDIALPPGGSVVEIERIRSLPPLHLSADLALSPLDIVVEGNVISGWVHNIGRQSAAARLTLMGREGGSRTLDLGIIESPDDLRPRRLPFRFEGATEVEMDGLLVIDANLEIDEITEVNNTVDLRDVRQAMKRTAEVSSALDRSER